MTRRAVLLVVLLLSGCALRSEQTSACSDPLGLYVDARYEACCTAHDNGYRVGGTEEDRLMLDQGLYLCVAAAGTEDDAESMFYAVRWFGGARFHYRKGLTDG